MINDDKENGSIIFNYGIMHNLSHTKEISAYAGISGGGYEASHDWAMHNIDDIRVVENKKYKGWIITDLMGIKTKVYIKKAILNIEATDWKHAFNLFKKYLMVAKPKQCG